MKKLKVYIKATKRNIPMDKVEEELAKIKAMTRDIPDVKIIVEEEEQ